MSQSDIHSIAVLRQRGFAGDLTGQVFGFWTALRPGSRGWLVRCQCGTVKELQTRRLIEGQSRSCGCMKGALISARYRGDTKRPEYAVYTNMIGRCHNPKNASFRDYGALGIAVCDRWRFGENDMTGFQCFLADMGPRPPRRTLDRKDPRLGYFKDNCRWATAIQQANNKREHYLTPDQKIELAEARRRANTVLSIEQEHEAIAMMNAGKRQRDVAAHFDVSQHTIATLCKAARRRGDLLNVSRRRMTPDQQVEAISLFNDGAKQTELARRYSVGKDALREMFRQARRSGVNIRSVASPHGKLTPGQRSELLEQFHAGENRQAIADRFSISRARIYQIARDYAAKEPREIS